MISQSPRGVLLGCLLVFLSAVCSSAERPAGANDAPFYQALRTGGFGQETYSVEGLTLEREGGLFKLTGTVWLLAPVNGKVPGAVFQGRGTFSIAPPLEHERRHLQVLTKGKEFAEEFEELVLWFSDGTYQQIKNAGKPVMATPPVGILEDARHKLRSTLQYNIYGRVLQDVMSQQPGGFFYAMIKGSHFGSKELFIVDPHGAPSVHPEEVSFQIYDDQSRGGVWSAYHLLNEYASGQAKSTQQNCWYNIERQKIEVTIEKSGKLSGQATTTVISRSPELRVIAFDLYPTLRVSKVTDSSGAALSFIQEDKDHDSDYYVILPRSLSNDEKFDIVTTYSGKDVVYNAGGGNYYPIEAARDSWYPNKGFWEYETYEMKFRVPRGMTLVATGIPVSSGEENGEWVSSWKSSVPQAVAGFNFGYFKKVESKQQKQLYTVESYTNKEQPDFVKAIQQYADGVFPVKEERLADRPQLSLGTLNTVQYGERALKEAELALRLYTAYFGPIPYQRVAVTQQYADNYGQSFPGLVYLPISYFFDSTVRHQLGYDDPHGYFRVVAPHEVAHQWWGHTVGVASYRDNWLSEGFAEASASIFRQLTSDKPDAFRDFWRDEKSLLLEKNKEGFRAIDVGPVVMGYRLETGRTGYDVSRRLIYPKGAFIMHMIRMMMWPSKQSDQVFQSMMTEFVQTHLNQPASTEDFKAIVEKYMTSGMDLEGNHKMDWFFNQYVYGMSLPKYTFESSLSDAADGSLVVNFKLTQSNVDDKFVMPVPIYLESPNGSTVLLGSARVRGNTTVERSVNLGKPQQRFKRAVLNYNYDVLADYQ